MFPKIGFSPQIIHFNRAFPYKPSILGNPYFRKHPYHNTWWSLLITTFKPHRLWNRNRTHPLFGGLKQRHPFFLNTGPQNLCKPLWRARSKFIDFVWTCRNIANTDAGGTVLFWLPQRPKFAWKMENNHVTFFCQAEFFGCLQVRRASSANLGKLTVSIQKRMQLHLLTNILQTWQQVQYKYRKRWHQSHLLKQGKQQHLYGIMKRKTTHSKFSQPWTLSKFSHSFLPNFYNKTSNQKLR